ncbi:MAG: TDP-N-acetylfucosamine:lipid II N-acetylfucosaminyltransferase [Synergistaceae bacterium]|nr:TDP-N-acetylfucosamine:lipid II N-acetylfucosaminyltransferase [Candidatus Equadaptatus faecalis]
MKVVHIMQDTAFTRDIVSFYDAFFDVYEHGILYLTEKGSPSLIDSTIHIGQQEIYVESKKYIKVFNRSFRFPPSIYCATQLAKLIINLDCDYIVMHSLFCPNLFTQFFLSLNKDFLRKMVWIAWGGDLDTWKPCGIRSILINAFRRLRTKCNTVVCIFPPDCDVYKTAFPNSQAHVFYAPYCGAAIPEEYKSYRSVSRLEQTIKEKDYVFVQIGHSATPELKHIAVLEKLSRYKEENIKLLIPLSYGDKDYADMVEKKAKEIFGNKAVILKEFMPAREYFALTKRVDIAIFNTYRQIGLGNINRLLFRNVKTYMPENSVMYNYFTETGVPVQKLSDLDNISFAEFSKPVKTKDEEAFMKYIDSLSDKELHVRLWQNVYDDLRNRLSENKKIKE